MAWDDGLTGTAYKIAATTDSPLRVMAGPGTGKSFALKRRVARLLEEGVKPDRIMAVTFTRTAAAALIEDLRDLGVPGCEEILVGTLHAYCFSLLMLRNVFDFLGRVPRPVVTFNKSGVLQFEAAPMLADLGSFGGKRECTKRIRAFEAAWARLQSDDPGWPIDAVDRAFQATLHEWLVFHKAILIGELVPETLRYLRDNPMAPEISRFDHVIVDEYQDLNKAEQTLIDLLSQRANHAIVGDADQSIYSFRYAHPEGILDFGETHPGTHDEPLQVCHRCPKMVVEIANHLVASNYPGGTVSQLHPCVDNPDGELAIVQWPSLDLEAAGIADFIQHLVGNRDYEPRDILVLSPRRLIGYGIRNALRDRNVPTHSFYHEELLEAEDAQRAFTLLTLLINPDDRVALRYWLGTGSPSLNVGEYARIREKCEETGYSLRQLLDDLVRGRLTMSRITSVLGRYRALQTCLAPLQGLAGTALVDMLFPPGKIWAEPIRETLSIGVEDGTEPKKILDILKTSITQPEMPEEGDFVRIMSLHKSKGLTSKVVVVAGCIQGLIPLADRETSVAEQRSSLREQRRLFYVALTRCREILVLSSVTALPRDTAYRMGAVLNGRGKIGRTITSQFVAELGPSAPRPVRGPDWVDCGFV